MLYGQPNKDSKSGPEPHKDWGTNLSISKKYLLLPDVKKGIHNNNITICWSGTNKVDGNFEIVTCISFHWKKDGINYCRPVNLHQDSSEFRGELSKLLGIDEFKQGWQR